jgi:catechol 2,3-dioxygenase-like lactoylglutathione lyase family enzyme
MNARFPPAVPEIPVENVEKASEYYVKVLGFSFDWGDESSGTAGPEFRVADLDGNQLRVFYDFSSDG